jgi:hypothetical protein
MGRRSPLERAAGKAGEPFGARPLRGVGSSGKISSQSADGVFTVRLSGKEVGEIDLNRIFRSL